MPAVSAVSNIAVATIQQNQQSMEHVNELRMPPAPTKHGGEGASAEASGPLGSSFSAPPLQVSFWESRNGPVSQIMMHIGNAIVTLLKLFTPKKGI